jgi:hypothetical protein
MRRLLGAESSSFFGRMNQSKFGPKGVGRRPSLRALAFVLFFVSQAVRYVLRISRTVFRTFYFRR